MDFKAALRRERRHIYITTALGVLSASYLAESVFYFRNGFFLLLAVSAVLAAADAVLLRAHGKRALPDAGGVSDGELQQLFDRYARRSVNWLLIAFWEVCGLLLAMIVLRVNSKGSELVEMLIGRRFTLELVAFFLVKNLRLVRLIHRLRPQEKLPLFRRALRRASLIPAAYWLIAAGIFYGFEKFFVLDISPFLSGLFLAGVVAYNFTKINEFTYSKKRHSRVVIASVLLIAAVCGGYLYLSRDIWLTQPYINATPYLYEGESKIAYDDATGVYTVTKPAGDFKILQLTDIHLGGGVLSYDKDLKALKAVYALLAATKPDLVIVTGDLCYPVGLSSFSFNNTAPVQQFAAFMRNTGIPWAFTYGNHDTESYAATDAQTLNEIYKSLSWKTSRTLMYPYVQPEITGRSNQLIELRNADGSLFEGLFLIDSNAYTGEGLNKYDYIHDDQVAWYRGEVLRMNASAGRTVPSLVFFHIPLQQYRTAYELYEQGSDEIKYFFGSNDESLFNKVCCSEYPSAIFDTAKELGSTTGFFCGHDHYNNMSLEYQGIRLTYGMSIDYLATPGIARDVKQRGATLIVLHDDGDTEISQVPLTSVQKEEP